jgi:MFS transporter, FHS family, glucose/mannose:H+ symporter
MPNPRQLAPALHVGFLFVGVVNTMLGPLLPLLAARWQLSDAQAGRLFVAQFMGGMVGSALSSVLIVRLGFLPLLAGGFAAMAAAAACVGLGSWGVGLTAVAASGVALGLTVPATNLLVSYLNPERRAAALSVLNLTWGVGAMCSPLVPLAARGGNLAAPLVALAGLIAALSAWVLLGSAGHLRELYASHVGAAREESAGSPLGLWLNRDALLVGLFFFLYSGTEAAAGGWVASYAERLGGAGQGAWALTPSLFYGGLIAGRAAATFVLLRLSERRFVLVGLALALAGLGIILTSGNVGGVSVGAALAGLGLAPVFPTLFALFAARFSAQSSKMAGGVFVLTSLGSSVIPWSVGLISSLTGELRWGLAVTVGGVAAQLVLQTAAFKALAREGVTG